MSYLSGEAPFVVTGSPARTPRSPRGGAAPTRSPRAAAPASARAPIKGRPYEYTVGDWERKAAARLGVSLPAEPPPPRPPAIEMRPSTARPVLTTEKLWQMKAAANRAADSAAAAAACGATSRAVADAYLEAPAPDWPPRARPTTAPAVSAPAAAAGAEATMPYEEQREAVKSAIAYFYRFAERHIDGESCALSSAADLQARALFPTSTPRCRRGGLRLTYSTLIHVQAMQDVLHEASDALQEAPLAAGLWRGCVAVLDRWAQVRRAAAQTDPPSSHPATPRAH